MTTQGTPEWMTDEQLAGRRQEYLTLYGPCTMVDMIEEIQRLRLALSAGQEVEAVTPAEAPNLQPPEIAPPKSAPRKTSAK